MAGAPGPSSRRPAWLALFVALAASRPLLAEPLSLRFYGAGVAAPGLDRVTIPLETNRPVDVGAGDFTIEVWLKALAGENTSTAPCNGAGDDWIRGNIVLDRDVFGPGDFGDWGLSLASGRVIFGVAIGNQGVTVCGGRVVADGTWHHLAVTRSGITGEIALFVDGAADGTAVGPVGDLSYRDGRSGVSPWDPYLVLGAEKHDAGAEYPSFSGWLDELRLSTVRRYLGSFIPARQIFAADAATAALYHFDEGAGTGVGDAAGGASPGSRRPGGTPEGPAWSTDSPFTPAIFADGFEGGTTASWSATVP